jgi:hypothetical protein
MKNVFFKDYVQIALPSNLTDDFEHLIGALNEPLEKNFGICICYDQDENGFSGFAITNKFHSETIYPEVKTSNLILKAFKDGVADALQAGYQAEFHEQMHYYKQGYDFGISQYSELKKLEGDYE